MININNPFLYQKIEEHLLYLLNNLSFFELNYANIRFHNSRQLRWKKVKWNYFFYISRRSLTEGGYSLVFLATGNLLGPWASSLYG